jgi:hypothetical protein
VPVLLTDQLQEMKEMIAHVQAVKEKSNAKDKNSVSVTDLQAAYAEFQVPSNQTALTRVKAIWHAVGDEGLQIMQQAVDSSMDLDKLFTYTALGLSSTGFCGKDIDKEVRLDILRKVATAGAAGVRECTTDKACSNCFIPHRMRFAHRLFLPISDNQTRQARQGRQRVHQGL